MKKITVSVAALSIAISSFGQCTSNPLEQECMTIKYKTIELIDSIREDMFYGRISEQVAGYYLRELLTIQRNSVNLASVVDKSQLSFDEEVNNFLMNTLTKDEWNELLITVNNN
jgi:hypothetical protein